MTVKQLIMLLEKQKPDAEVRINSQNWGNVVKIEKVETKTRADTKDGLVLITIEGGIQT